MTEQEQVIRLYGRHCVSLCWFDTSPAVAGENEGRGKRFDVSGFIISVSRQWYLITAGHILHDIDEAMRKGQQLSSFYVADWWGHGPKYLPQIFDYRGADKGFDYDETTGVDFGFIRLDDNITARLSANGVVPLDETYWPNDLGELHDFFICGFPSCLQGTTPLSNGITLSACLVMFRLGVEKGDIRRLPAVTQHRRNLPAGRRCNPDIAATLF